MSASFCEKSHGRQAVCTRQSVNGWGKSLVVAARTTALRSAVEVAGVEESCALYNCNKYTVGRDCMREHRAEWPRTTHDTRAAETVGGVKRELVWLYLKLLCFRQKILRTRRRPLAFSGGYSYVDNTEYQDICQRKISNHV